jgi:hypothetical protein
MQRLLKGPPHEPEEGGVGNDPFAGGDRFYLQLPDLLESYYEIRFPSGTSAYFSPNRGELVVRQTADGIAEIEALLNSLGPMESFVLDENLFRPIGNLVLNGGEYPSGLATRKWHVAPEVMDAFLDSTEIQAEHDVDPFADRTEASQPMQGEVRQRTLSEALGEFGIAVGDGALVVYDRDSATVTSVNTESNAFYTEIVLLDSAIAVSRESAKPKARLDQPLLRRESKIEQ